MNCGSDVLTISVGPIGDEACMYFGIVLGSEPMAATECRVTFALTFFIFGGGGLLEIVHHYSGPDLSWSSEFGLR